MSIMEAGRGTGGSVENASFFSPLQSPVKERFHLDSNNWTIVISPYMFKS